MAKLEHAVPTVKSTHQRLSLQQAVQVTRLAAPEDDFD